MRMAEVEAYAYLWDGSEPGWKLRWTRRPAWRIRVVFAGAQPTKDEVRALRLLVPELGVLAAKDVLADLGDASHYDWPEAVGSSEKDVILERAAKLELKVDVVEEDHGVGVPVRNGEPLVIEDDAVAREVCARMEAAGVEVELD